MGAGRIAAPPLPVRVAVARDDAAEKRNGLFVRHTLLPPTDVTLAAGLSVTAGTRTAVDVLCAERRLGRYRVIEIVDQLLNLGCTTQEEIRAVLERSHQRGVVRARMLLPETEPLAGSGQETRLRLIIVDGGLPRPEAQWVVLDADGRFVARCDLGYDDVRLGLEYHGKQHAEQLAYDWDRAGAIDVRGAARVIAFTAEHLRVPAHVVRRVREARARRV